MKITLKWLIIQLLFLLCVMQQAGAITLEQIQLHEHPKFTVSDANLSIGRNGNLYLAVNGGKYALRISPDGTAKSGSELAYHATRNIVANAQGMMAAAHSHFSHSVFFYDTNFANTGTYADFDGSQYRAPYGIEVGSSGDFYAVDITAYNLKRLNVNRQLIATYKYPPTFPLVAFRVCEATKNFYLLDNTGRLLVIGFDGTEKWTVKTSIGWPGAPEWIIGGFDVDDNGILYLIDGRGTTVKRYSAAGQELADLPLDMAKLAPSRDGQDYIMDLRVTAAQLFIKRHHPYELFQSYQLADGKLLRAVNADYARLAVSYASDIWTAGETLPISITLESSARTIAPFWRVWLRPFNTPTYREIAWVDGKITVPLDYAGLYQVKVSPGLSGSDADYQVQGIVEVRQPNTNGSATVLTPNNRIYYGRSEAIPFTIKFRSNAALPREVTALLIYGEQVLAEGRIPIADGKDAAFLVPASLTRALQPGNYKLSVQAEGLTGIVQTLIIGPGMPSITPFFCMNYGDYDGVFTLPTGVWDTPEVVARHIARSQKLGINLVVDRMGNHTNIGLLEWSNSPQNRGILDTLTSRLQADNLAVAPERAAIESPTLQRIAGYSAAGISQMDILIYMDAGLPLGTGIGERSKDELAAAISKINTALLPYPAFRGWSWSANWWLTKHLADGANSPEQKTAYLAAVKEAEEKGTWNPLLDTVSDQWLHYAVAEQDFFNNVLHKVAPGKVTAVAGPYRAPQVYPPVTFSNVDEVDLHYQAEQIAPPQTAVHNVDYQRRPGKRAWGHPEFWNESGSGDMLFTTLFQMVMRGADGVGVSSGIPPWGYHMGDDPRNSGAGIPSVFRTFNNMLTPYGNWLTSLKNNDKIAILVSGRMARIDNWGGIGGQHFTRLFEAYNACLYAHHPASFVYVEDIKPDSLTRFKAVLLVDQRVEIEPALTASLAQARKAGVQVFYDSTCRKELMNGYLPLSVAFNSVEKDPSVWQDDGAYTRFPGYFREEAKELRQAFAKISPPVAQVDNSEILMSERVSGSGRFLFVVNNTMLEISPTLLWRMNMFIANRTPLVAPVNIGTAGGAVYDVFAMRQVTPEQGVVQADLRNMPMRLYAILPKPIAQVALRGPRNLKAGETFSWQASVQDATGTPINSGLPIRLRLLAENDTLLEEIYSTALSNGAAGNMTLARNVPSGPVTLEVSELISGKCARLLITVAPITAPAVLTNQSTIQEIPPITPAVRSVGAEQTAGLIAPEERFGPHVRDITLTANGSLAVLNTMNWNHNLYALDTASGKVRWQQRVGQYFAFSPVAQSNGIALQGFDFTTPEGYHLYRVSANGEIERRFALYGLPKRLPEWCTPKILRENINHFAAAPDGAWVATAGDLGLALWSRDGELRWAQNWWKNGQRHTAVLTALNASTLITAVGMRIVAYEAEKGTERWQLILGKDGEIQEMLPSSDGAKLAVRASTNGGRIFIVQDGKLINEIPAAASALAWSGDNRHLAVTVENHLKWYSLDKGLQWSFTGDDMLHNPRVSTDGKRVAVSSELGTVSIFDVGGSLLNERDLGSLAVPGWLPNGDILLATWMGDVLRLDSKFSLLWQTHLQPREVDMRGKILTQDTTPTARIENWGNALPAALPLMPNLLSSVPVRVEFLLGRNGVNLQNKPETLSDGIGDAPAKPWLDDSLLSGLALNQYSSEGLEGAMSIVFDTHRTQFRVTGITLVEDPAHPESWARDARFDAWDAEKQIWVTVQSLLSNAAIHTHMFATPAEARRFRLVLPTVVTGNLRLAEVVLHGEVLGASHADVLAKRPLATIFDEQGDLSWILQKGKSEFAFNDAFSGIRYIRVEGDASTVLPYVAVFGHEMPDWDFEIAENPQPGQYRYLQFSYKALSKETQQLQLQIVGVNGGALLYAGTKPATSWLGGTERKIAETPPNGWETVRVDLWEIIQKPARLRMLVLSSQGGAAGFDSILLARTQQDLPPIK